MSVFVAKKYDVEFAAVGGIQIEDINALVAELRNYNADAIDFVDEGVRDQFAKLELAKALAFNAFTDKTKAIVETLLLNSESDLVVVEV